MSEQIETRVEFQVRYEYEIAEGNWVERTLDILGCQSHREAQLELQRRIQIGFGWCRRNIRIESRTVTKSAWREVQP